MVFIFKVDLIDVAIILFSVWAGEKSRTWTEHSMCKDLCDMSHYLYFGDAAHLTEVCLMKRFSLYLYRKIYLCIINFGGFSAFVLIFIAFANKLFRRDRASSFGDNLSCYSWIIISFYVREIMRSVLFASTNQIMFLSDFLLVTLFLVA